MTEPTEQQILEAAFAPAQPAAEASRFGGLALQAMIIARCVEKDQAGSVLEDADRYRWLRNPTTNVALVLDKRTGYVPEDERVPGVGGYHTYEYRAGDELDAAIDAARAAQEGKK